MDNKNMVTDIPTEMVTDIPNHSQSSNKIKVFLDLDNTVISSEPLDSLDVEKYKDKAAKFQFHNMDDYYIVFERPYLQMFLDYLFKHFDVNVWTAASKDYALFIINNILLQDKSDPSKDISDRKIHYFLFSYHCKWSEKTNGCHKGLQLVWDIIPDYNNTNTIIVDDLKEVHADQPYNGYNIKPFEFKGEYSENDPELLKLMDILEQIKNKNNI